MGDLKRYDHTLFTIITVWLMQKNTLFIILVNREIKTKTLRMSKIKKHKTQSEFLQDNKKSVCLL